MIDEGQQKSAQEQADPQRLHRSVNPGARVRQADRPIRRAFEGKAR
jgi:hypothetical protein